MRTALQFLFVCLSAVLLHGAEQEQEERSLHLPESVLLLGYPQDDTLLVTSNGQDLTLQPPGPNRTGHHTYPSLSRDGTVVATSYVRSSYPQYREGIATYSLSRRQWKQYEVGDFSYVWAATISPDASQLAFAADRDGKEASPLVLLDLNTSGTTVLIERFLATAPVTWSPDGLHIAYEQPLRRPDPRVDLIEYEIRVRDIRNQGDRRLALGSKPSWSPSGEWIAYLTNDGALAITHPDGTGEATLVSLHRRFPWFYKRRFMYPPVWSKDSTIVLLNESAADETARALIHRFELETRKLRRLKRAGVAALGWAE